MPLVLALAVALPRPAPAATGPMRTAPPARRASQALEEQLRCRRNPQPARLVRGLLAQGFLRPTPYGHDGSPVWVPRAPLTVFGVPVRYVTGWQADAHDQPLRPFTRGPGTMPPWFLAVTVAARPAPGRFVPSRPRPVGDAGAGAPTGPFAALDDHGADNKPGIVLTCYGD